MYRIPIYRLTLVREHSVAAETNTVSANTPAAAAKILRDYLEGADREHFVVLMLNAKNKVIGIHTATIGTLTSSLVHPREIFKPAIVSSAHGVIIAHNHPSGDPTPSKEDGDVTKRLVQAGEVIGIKVLDHIVVGDPGYYSFREAGMM